MKKRAASLRDVIMRWLFRKRHADWKRLQIKAAKNQERWDSML